MIKRTIIGIFVLRIIFLGLHLDCCWGQVLYKSDHCCYECYQKNTAGTSSVADGHQGETSSKIAFSANFYASSQHLNNTNQIVVFKDVLVNHGSGYNAKSGIFTTPEAGTYAFFFSVQVPKNVRLSTLLVFNGKPVSESLAGRIPVINTGGNMAVLPLQKGDKVWVQTHFKLDWINWSGEVILMYSGNSFSGFLLF
ncbi:collagen alpha-2(VIII) chain-like [Crassostrea angulata]|uniref:collagen alpha-2(VIII) chain-like n=1 Tax=Magallana angulata TaxID=2784310 RepID=UPI0022B1A2CD|nr:collagen alpha-2(VIII) chain-like [Crassostrea angulata]